MCCRHVLRTQNLHKIVVGLSEILNRNWNTSRTSLHLLGSIKEVLYIIYVLLTTSLTLSACLDACLLCSCRLGLHISGEEQKSMGWNQTQLMSDCSFGSTTKISHLLHMMQLMVLSFSFSCSQSMRQTHSNLKTVFASQTSFFNQTNVKWWIYFRTTKQCLKFWDSQNEFFI